ncbi:MAG: sigma-70 family RNA polymerase sigma factor [Bacteroidota bacterium]|nr:sigma-70 family RNA polymerase sigma factor [Bacteroidota bacterium]MDP4235453.1 sigma-70 family RNA polymerase sigma factor [Bacteroidota bacterium]
MSEGRKPKTNVTFSDEELWITFREGDDSAYTLLYFRYADRLYSYLRLLLGSGPERHNIEDVFQETWIRVYREKEKFEIRDAGTFSGWLFRIAHNFAISLVRRPHYVSSFNELADDKFLYDYASTSAQDTLHDEHSAQEILALLRAVVEELPLSLREVYLLSEFERMNMDQVVETLGVTKANAKVRLFRARKIVRERMVVVLGIDKNVADNMKGHDNLI